MKYRSGPRWSAALVLILLVVPVWAFGEAKKGGFEKEWGELRKRAQEEGEVVGFICCGIGRSVGKLIGEFEEKYKLKVVFSTGSSGQQADRVLAERKAGVYSLDVWMGGITSANTRLLPANSVDPIGPLLIHPEVLDKKAWYGGEGPLLMDPDRKYLVAFAGNGGLTSEITYNTKLVNPDEINSFWDLLNPKWRGKMVGRDPGSAGVGQSTAFYYMHPQIGPDFLRRLLTEMRVTIAPNARQAAEWLALGKYAICLFACGREVRALMEQGMPVRDELPKVLKEAPRIGVGGGAIWAMNRPPHPHAQKFFINWWLTRDGQLLMQRADGDDSLRVDIPKEMVNKSDRRLEGVDYWFPDRDPEFERKLGEALKFARQFVGARRR